MNHEPVSPFALKEDLSLTMISRAESISPKRLNQLLLEGQLHERSEMIIRLLWEFGYLTSSLLTLAFSHPNIPARFKKLRTNQSSPYDQDLKYLESMGIVKKHFFCNSEGERKSSNIYSIAKTVSQWSQIRWGHQPYLYRFSSEFDGDSKEILETLSNNQFLISMRYHYPQYRFNIGETIEIVALDGLSKFIVMNIRNADITIFKNLCKKIYIEQSYPSCNAIFILVPDIEIAKDIYKVILHEVDASPMYFITDRSCYNLSNPLEHAIKFEMDYKTFTIGNYTL